MKTAVRGAGQLGPARPEAEAKVKKLILWGLVALLLIVFAPVLLNLLRPDTSRAYEGETLDSARYSEIRFRNTEQGIDLAGMLFLPETSGPFPAVALIHGSGGSSRDHRWNLTLAHYLQDRGIAVLVPDKRGSERSAGDWRNASFDELAADAEAAIEYLRQRDDLALTRIGVIGMSQGGWIAPLVADRSPDLDFLVNVVGPAVSTHEQLLYEEAHNLEQMGMLPGVSRALAYPSTFVLRHFRQRTFWDAIGDFDPLPYWNRIALPALVLLGADDSNMPTDESAERLRALDKPNIEIIIFPGSGHALQDAPGTGDRLIRIDALQAIVKFIHGTEP